MQPLSLTPKEDWAVSKAKPDNMVLAGTSWPGKTLYWWKMCFSFPLLLQVLTQERKGWSSFAGLNQALRRQKAKMRKVKSSKEMIPCIIPSTSMTLGGFSVLQWLQAAGPLILPDFQVQAQWFQVLDPCQQLSAFAFQISVTICGISHSSVQQSVSHAGVCHPFWQTNLAMAAWTQLQCCCSKQEAKPNPRCAGDDTSTSAATTANLLSCTWYSELSQAAGDHC